jgi:hypothetical protein
MDPCMIAMSGVACFSVADGSDRWAVMREKLVISNL